MDARAVTAHKLTGALRFRFRQPSLRITSATRVTLPTASLRADARSLPAVFATTKPLIVARQPVPGVFAIHSAMLNMAHANDWPVPIVTTLQVACSSRARYLHPLV